MGVPVISIAGAHHVARVSSGLLARQGLDDWVATDWRSYVDVAIRKASDREQLASFRSTARERLLASTICEPGRVTRDLESAYREMWKRWCNGNVQNKPGDRQL
jgi:predicted O-linked N-acetylglucosamine transferase (SPINDLY family)